MQNHTQLTRPTIGLLYLDHVLRFFDRSNFKGWPDKIEQVVYHWGNDKERFINEVKNKNIDVLIGNIPATAYETFREISRALPHVKFIPSLDAQFCNKSKENVTHFCHKYQLPIPKTEIFYQVEDAIQYISKTSYPKIIKRSYGPSNYGGYFVHKVDSADDAIKLFSERRYFPAYIQDFVPMKADIRVMLIGHKPVCAFWRRPPEGEWLTNTSQGGSMDYQNIPEEVLALSIKASKAAKAEYWACDIAVSQDDKYTILECATAFAAFPYIRDWIGQYLMWQLAPALFKQPYFPHKNWEELGKISSSLLRTMRHITFGEACISTDTGELHPDDNPYDLEYVDSQQQEEWPSEVWNRQGLHAGDNGLNQFLAQFLKPASQSLVKEQHLDTGIEQQSEHPHCDQIPSEDALTREALIVFLTSVKGIGHHLANDVVETLGVAGAIESLNHDHAQLLSIRHLKQKKLDAIIAAWAAQQSDIEAE